MLRAGLSLFSSGDLCLFLFGYGCRTHECRRSNHRGKQHGAVQWVYSSGSYTYEGVLEADNAGGMFGSYVDGQNTVAVRDTA